MESYVRTSNSKRFVVEDSITKVTSDGEPHEMMTMIAGLSGLVAAIVILAIVVSIVGCKKKRSQHCSNCSIHSGVSSIAKLSPASSVRGSVASEHKCSISRAQSIRVAGLPATLSTVSVIHTGNLEGNMNAAFVGSELSLSGSLQKIKKKTHWSDEIERQETVKETRIDIERY